tara:strand:- start:174 stop:275 length:102 start_codon:yes stop_codon:yes gene_type:complete
MEIRPNWQEEGKMPELTGKIKSRLAKRKQKKTS